jgi:two-component system response regulator (stage 0 sporulation protein F)
MSNWATILYVDDEPLNLQLFAINFERMYTVKTAVSGNAGLEILRDEPSISVVISDMKMPGLNGIEFIRKAKEKYPEITFFILTGYDITNEILEALNDKLINSYFSKPFNIKVIEKSIQEVLK